MDSHYMFSLALWQAVMYYAGNPCTLYTAAEDSLHTPTHIPSYEAAQCMGIAFSNASVPSITVFHAGSRGSEQ